MAIDLAARIAILAVLVMPAAVCAGPVSGTVSDPQGLPVLGAQVTIRCSARQYATKTDMRGQFAFKEIPEGDCSLLVRHPGFAPFEQRMDPRVEQTQVRLELASTTDHIDVAAEAGTVDLMDRKINSVSLANEDLRAVSNDTADWIRYAKLMAGVTYGSDTIYVDGLPATSLPPAETVSRISVNSDPFSAEYSDGDSTHIDVITKNGDRTFGLSFGGLSLGAGGHNVLASGLRSKSRSGQGDFKGYIPRLPITFAIHWNMGKKLDDQPILAIFPATGSVGSALIPVKASVGGSSFLGSLDAFYSHKNLRAHLSLYDTRTNGSNLGVGGIVMPEAGLTSRTDSRELRATVNDSFEGLLYLGGIVAAETRSATNANTTAAGITVPGAFVDGGAPMTMNQSYGTHWTLKNVLQSSTAPGSWTTGLTISGIEDSKLSVPNPAGSFMFSDLQAYTDALAGDGTGTWFLTHGNGTANYAGISAAPFFQKTILHSKNALLTAGIRGDYQSGFRLMASPRLSAAAERGGFVVRYGAGLFVRNITSNVFLRAIDNDPTHLQESIVTGISLLDGAIGTDVPVTGIVHSQVAAGLTRPREIMQKASIERRFGHFTAGTEYTWNHDRHLLGSQRLPDTNGWVDVLESNRSADRQRLHSQLRYTWRSQSLMAHYEWVRSRDDTSGPYSFPAEQDDIRAEWARSAGIAPHNVTLVANAKLPGGISLIATDTWRGSAPYNITSGLDPANNGLFTDRGGLARNSGNNPANNSLSCYAYRRIAVPWLSVKRKRIYVDLGIRGENILGGKEYTTVGSVLGSPTFGQPLTALPGRAVRLWLNVN